VRVAPGRATFLTLLRGDRRTMEEGRGPSSARLIERIISGGQTGADRGGLDAAIALGLRHGGWCPKDRAAEDGVVPARYEVREANSPG